MELRLKDRPIPIFVAWFALATLTFLGTMFFLWSGLAFWIGFAEGHIPFAGALLYSLAQLPILAILFLSAIRLSDDQIVLTRDGLSFPGYMCAELSPRVELPWSALRKISMSKTDSTTFLCLYFHPGKAIKLPIFKLKKNDLEQLAIALEVWAPHAEGLVELEQIKGDTNSSALASYTKIWEDELNNRFGSTNFGPLQPGMTLRDGKITVVRQLAFGGLSAIYLVKDWEGNLFVLKESVVPDNSEEELRQKAEEFFNREAHFLSNLNHPQIARVYDHFVEQGRNYLLLEYIEGENLRTLVRRGGTIDEKVVVDWAIEIARILDYLHKQSTPVIHRDISPENLMLHDGHITLIDFGAANQFLGTATGTMIGKQAYISPEQLKGKATPQSDIYSLGATLHFLLTGHDPEALTSSHPAGVNFAVSAKLDALIAKCTALDLGERYLNAQDLIEDLSSITDRVIHLNKMQQY